MAAITPSCSEARQQQGRKIVRTSGTSTANQTDTLTMAAPGEVRRLISMAAAYSCCPTQAGVTFAWTPACGSAITLSTGSACAINSVYIPSDDFYVLPCDTFTITMPAGGACITATGFITTESK